MARREALQALAWAPLEMRIFKTKWFTRFARRQDISDAALRDAVRRMTQGLVDADLGGHLVKQRIARSGQGRSGGFRSIVVFRKEERAFFIDGFAKNEKASLSRSEEAALKDAAADYMALTDRQLDDLVTTGMLVEIDPDD